MKKLLTVLALSPAAFLFPGCAVEKETIRETEQVQPQLIRERESRTIERESGTMYAPSQSRSDGDRVNVYVHDVDRPEPAPQPQYQPRVDDDDSEVEFRYRDRD